MKNGTVKILLIEDEKPEIYARRLESEKFGVVTARSGSEGISKFEGSSVDAVFLDLRLPDLHGFEVLKKIREIDPLIPVFVMTAYGDIESASTSHKRGAVEFLVKGSIDWDGIPELIHNHVKKRKIELDAAKVKRTLNEGSGKYSPPLAIVGQSFKMKEVFATLARIGEQDVTVLIQGESGTGKELIARTLHLQSIRKDKPFVAVNCAAIPEALLESELFGYERGAFTGAVEANIGKFEYASDGTIFLDEIGDLSLHAQAKILRVLEQREFERIGSSKSIKTGARVITATSKNLEEGIKARTFRGDLFYRLNVVSIHLPPLRERKEDIPLLCEYALKMFNDKYNKKVRQISAESMSYLFKYGWPGNVRELIHIIESGVILSRETALSPDALPEKIKNIEPQPSSDLRLDSMIRSHISDVLKSASGNRSKAAKVLGIDRKRLGRIIRKHDLNI
jgi:DNA-binding NtrC family response regulator